MTLEMYIKNTLLLSNSLIIKNTDTALAINRGLLTSKFYQSGDKPEEWKYYLNLAGKRHITDEVVEVKVLENNKYMPLSPSLLEKYKYTKEELSNFGDYYKQLIEKYPEYDLFIKGCINPVDMDYAIHAKEGTILSYNKNLVEYNEYNLIRDLEKYIKGFLHRWNVKAFNLTDNLYTAGMLAVLYSTLPSKIMNIRLDNVNSNQVHSFYLENFFRSHLELQDNVSILNQETKHWLYRNLLYILKTVGKESTLNLLIDKVFEANGIGIGEYSVRLLDPILTKNIEDRSKATYEYKEPIVVSKMLNQSYKVKDGEEYTIENIVAKQMKALDTITEIATEERDNYIVKQEINNLSKLITDKQKTKILDININRLYKRYGFDIFTILLDHWIFSAHYEKYVNIIEFDSTTSKPEYTGDKSVIPFVDFVDPISNKSYTVTPKIGFFMLLKAILYLVGTPKLKLKSYRLSTVMNPEADNLINIFNKMYKDGYTDLLITKLIDHYPVILKEIALPDMFKEYIDKIISYYSYIWSLDSNSESGFISGSIKTLFNYNMYQDDILLSDNPEGEDIDSILEKYGVDFQLEENSDVVSIINAIIRTFTKKEVDEYIELNTILYHCKAILNKLTAYTTQVITTLDDSKSIPVFYNNIPVLRTKHGLISINKTEFFGLEQENVNLSGEILKWAEQTRWSTDYAIAPIKAYCNTEINGLTEIYDLEADALSPRNFITVSDTYEFNKELCLGKDVFILDVTGEVSDLENEHIHTNATYGQYVETKSIYNTNSVPSTTKIDKDYESNMIITNTKDITLTPIQNITVFNDSVIDSRYKDKHNNFISNVIGDITSIENSNINVTAERVEFYNEPTNMGIEPLQHTSKELLDGETEGIVKQKDTILTLTPDVIISVDDE